MAKMGVIVICLSLLLMVVTIRAFEILDTDNNPVIMSEQYFIIDKDTLDDKGKTIKASHAPQTFAHACPRVAIIPYEERSSYYQVPVSFSSNDWYSSIRDGLNISIKYEIGKWPCPRENPVWTVDHETIIQTSDISFGGKPYRPLTTFQIKKEGDGYKFTHYNTETKRTEFVGVLNAPKLGYKRLVLSKKFRPFVFVLEKSETAFKRSSILSMIPNFYA